MNPACRITPRAVALLALNGVAAQEIAPGDAQKPQGGAPVPALQAEVFRKLLQEALREIKAAETEAAKDDYPSFDFGTRRLRCSLAAPFRAIGIAQARLQDRAAAQSTWQDALDAASTITELPAKAEALLRIAQAQLSAGEKTTALTTLQLALQAEIQALAGDFAGVADTAAALPYDEYNFDDELEPLLELIAREQAAKGDVRGALNWAAKQEKVMMKLAAMRGMAEGMARRPAAPSSM